MLENILMLDSHYWVLGNSRFCYEFINYFSRSKYSMTHIDSIINLPDLISLNATKNNFIFWAGGTSNSSIINLDHDKLKFQEVFSFFQKSLVTFKHIYLSSAGTLYPLSDIYQNENTHILPRTVYAKNKLIEELCIKDLVNKGDSYIIFRLANAYGSRLKSGDTGLITLIDKVIAGDRKLPISIRTNLLSRRQYGLYEDYTLNMCKIIESNFILNKTINLAPSFSYSISEIISLYKKYGTDLIQTHSLDLLTSVDKDLDTLLVSSVYDLDFLKLNWNSLDNWLLNR